jgi:hypothetical protein
VKVNKKKLHRFMNPAMVPLRSGHVEARQVSQATTDGLAVKGNVYLQSGSHATVVDAIPDCKRKLSE